MEKPINKLPARQIRTLYNYESPAGLSETTTTTGGDPTTTVITILTTTHIWHK